MSRPQGASNVKRKLQLSNLPEKTLQAQSSGAQPLPFRTTILIVEDNNRLRLALRKMLSYCDDFEIMSDTDSGERAIEIVERYAPDVVILDWILKDGYMSGAKTLERILAINSLTRVVILSSHGSEYEVLPALKLGAIGYVKKTPDTLNEEIIEAIRDASRRLYHMTVPAITTLVATRLEEAQPNESTPLSDREVKVLNLLQNGDTNQDIASRLAISMETVKLHISNVMRKSVIPNPGLSEKTKYPVGWSPPRSQGARS